MKKYFVYGVVIVIIIVAIYLFFFAGRGGLKLQETTKTANSISTSSISKKPVEGMVLEQGDCKLTVVGVEENQVVFTADVLKQDSNYCVPGVTNETFTLKKGEKLSISSCSNSEINYNISY
jgi:hypothetical protein